MTTVMWLMSTIVAVILVLPGVVGAEPSSQNGCTPRPRVNLQVTNSGTDTLHVVVSVSPTGAGAPNELRALRFGMARHARIDVPGGPTSSTGGFEQPYPAGTVQAQFTVRRDGGAMHVPFTAVDACGEWPTFVGGGSAVSQPAPPPPPTYPAPGSRLYALALGRPDLAVIDAATDQVVTVIRYANDVVSPTFRALPAATSDPPDLLIHPSGRQVYLTYRSETLGIDVLVAIDTALNQVVKRFELGPSATPTSPGLLLSQDGRYLVVLRDYFPVIDTQTLTLERTLPNTINVGAPVFNLTGRRLLVPTFLGVMLTDVVSGQIVRNLDLGQGGRIAFDPARNRVYSSPGTWVLDATTLDPLPLGSGGRLNPAAPHGGSAPSWIALSADGSRVVEAYPGCPNPSQCDGLISVFDTATGCRLAPLR